MAARYQRVNGIAEWAIPSHKEHGFIKQRARPIRKTYVVFGADLLDHAPDHPSPILERNVATRLWFQIDNPADGIAVYYLNPPTVRTRMVEVFHVDRLRISAERLADPQIVLCGLAELPDSQTRQDPSPDAEGTC